MSGTGDGTTPDKPALPAKALSLLRLGDTLSLDGHSQPFTTPRTPQHWSVFGIPHGLVCNVTSHNGRATVDAENGITFLQSAGPIEVSGIDFLDSARNPLAPNFKPMPGGNGLSFRQCDGADIKVHDCSFRYMALGIDCEANTQKSLAIERVVIRDIFGMGGTRAQGIFVSGVAIGYMRGSYLETVGWCPGVEKAINQNHGGYIHWDDGNRTGPFTYDDDVFLNCAAAGPTSNSGGYCNDSLIIDCAKDGSGMQAWLSRDRGDFTNNFVVGGFYNAISVAGTVTDNIFINPGPFGINIDVPAQTQGWRKTGGIIEVDRNVGFGSPSPLVKVTNDGGTAPKLGGQNESFVRMGPQMEVAIRARAAQRLAALLKGWGQ